MNEAIYTCCQLFDSENFRAVAIRGTLWPNGSGLGIKFLDGTQEQKELVMKAAEEWNQYAGITFFETDNIFAPVRVSFMAPGYWANVGTSAKKTKFGHPTVNLGHLLDDGDYDMAYGAALHELGHVLGLTHEQFSPEININWDEKAVYEYYNRLYGWSPQKIRDNVLQTVSRDNPHTPQFDPHSIMLYPIPAELTVDGQAIPWRNLVLSELDKQFIAELYPPVVGMG